MQSCQAPSLTASISQVHEDAGTRRACWAQSSDEDATLFLARQVAGPLDRSVARNNAVDYSSPACALTMTKINEISQKLFRQAVALDGLRRIFATGDCQREQLNSRRTAPSQTGYALDKANDFALAKQLLYFSLAGNTDKTAEGHLRSIWHLQIFCFGRYFGRSGLAPTHKRWVKIDQANTAHCQCIFKA